MKKILFGLFLLLALSMFISFCNNGGGEPTGDGKQKPVEDSIAVKDTTVKK